MGAERDGRAGRGPGTVARRAIRTTLAACGSFYLFLYGLDQPVAATYALFGVVSMAALSHIPGTGRQRAAVMARTMPAVWLLVAAGTFLAVRTWSAVAGMLVIGFALAFVAAAGPRAAGANPGLQLLYIMPSFPPYAPDTLGARLLGVTFGLVLLVLAELFVLPEPRGPTYRQRAAEAGRVAARCADELGRAPYTLSAATVADLHAAGEALRPLRVDEADRPAGPGLRDRALAHAGLAARTLLGRMQHLPAPPPGKAPLKPGADLLDAVGRAAAATADLLAGTGTGGGRDGRHVGGGAGDGAHGGGAHGEAMRLRRLREEAGDRAEHEEHGLTAARGRRRAALLEVADAAAAFDTASEIAVRGRRARIPGGVDAIRFWYAGRSAPQLWGHRLLAHAGPRSVYFQNAVRIALALGAARTVAGVESLPHGFWAMLAVLSLTRTTAAQTRATVRQALAGTLLGALSAAGVLALVGGRTTVYAVVLPVIMVVAFRVGPVRGVGWAQGMFTLVVSFVFAQLAPVTWRLAEVRLMDVLIGSMIGVVFGLLAWPRGAQAELHRAVAELLEREAEAVERTTAAVVAGMPGAVPDDRALRRALALAESAYAQRQGEPRAPAPGAPDWQAAMMTGHHVLWGSRRLLARSGPVLDLVHRDRLGGRTAALVAQIYAAAQRARAATPAAPVPAPSLSAAPASGAGAPPEPDTASAAAEPARAGGSPPGTAAGPGAAAASGGAGGGPAPTAGADPEAADPEAADPEAPADGQGYPDTPESVAPSRYFGALAWLESLTVDVDRVLAPCRAGAAPPRK
ncbi:FUSC family protein [Streptomyces sp. NRRL F-2664]|uniref:FUSC family protein n=1 Tax=Streptomyces sp. NRRL F-2664 TaxID=1463842 RepID=UPI0007C6E404|nr:FUSC family protein [Streptomyces sp. NRRL F-2664]